MYTTKTIGVLKVGFVLHYHPLFNVDVDIVDLLY